VTTLVKCQNLFEPFQNFIVGAPSVNHRDKTRTIDILALYLPKMGAMVRPEISKKSRLLEAY